MGIHGLSTTSNGQENGWVLKNAPLGECVCFLQTDTVTEGIYYLCRSSHVAIFNVPKPRVTPNFMSTSTGRRLTFCTMDTCSPATSYLHFCLTSMHSTSGASESPHSQQWQRQLARPRKFSVGKTINKSTRSREQAKSMVKTVIRQSMTGDLQNWTRNFSVRFVSSSKIGCNHPGK